MNGQRTSDPDCECDDYMGDYHSCPFQEEVHGETDDETCDCCPACERECGQSI